MRLYLASSSSSILTRRSNHACHAFSRHASTIRYHSSPSHLRTFAITSTRLISNSAPSASTSSTSSSTTASPLAPLSDPTGASLPQPPWSLRSHAPLMHTSSPVAIDSSAPAPPVRATGTDVSAAEKVSAIEEEVQHAVVSVFDMFSIGVGPSSSHTVGPMRAAKIFVEDLNSLSLISRVQTIRVDLFGSLALTGVGHGTPGAILMGLEGETPEHVDAKGIPQRVNDIKTLRKLKLRGEKIIPFDYEKNLIFHYAESLPQHPNGMRVSCFDIEGDLVATNEFFSIGGGFVINEHIQTLSSSSPTPTAHSEHENVYFKDDRIDHRQKISDEELDGLDPSNININVSHPKRSKPPKQSPGLPVAPAVKVDSRQVSAALPFFNAASLLDVCREQNLSIAEVVFKNELQWRSSEEVKRRVLGIWHVMDQSIRSGIHSNEEHLPGALRVKRRAPPLYRKLMTGFAEFAGFSMNPQGTASDLNGVLSGGAGIVPPPSTSVGPFGSSSKRVMKRSLPALDWISLYALAVNEENAAGGRVVTAPTNGAAGTIPAVLKYYLDFICPSPSHAEQDIVEFLLTAAAVGMLYKRGASISAAEMGCQGEVGVACSMAAAAFTAVMGGTVEQVENAAEIGMEHNLGLTCDPPMGLVVIPCIERNALAAVKAVTAAQLALNGDGTHRVTLDQCIATMRQTGMDMMSKYKETSEGGLAVNVPVC